LESGLDWQIGSKSPPKVCLCCGTPFDDKEHRMRGPYLTMPYIWVCEWCWRKPYLFFPDRFSNQQMRQRSIYATNNNVAVLINMTIHHRGMSGLQGRSKVIPVDVIRLHQKGVTMYVGKMRAEDLHPLWEIDKFRVEDLDGYQRKLYEERTKEVLEYLINCQVPVLPAVLVSLRTGAAFKPRYEGSDLGVLEIPYEKGAIWVIDGQHRLGGFARGFRYLQGEELIDVPQPYRIEELQALKDFEVPVVFIDSESACREVRSALTDPSISIGPRDIERVIFFIVNKTAKSISPSLKDALAYKIKAAGIGGIPIIERTPWRIDATKIAMAIFRDGKVGSPFSGLMKITGIETRVTRGVGRPLTLNTFVSSLEDLVKNDRFKSLDFERQVAFVAAYWRVIRMLKGEAFTEPQNYMVLKSIGVYALNYLANDVFNWCYDENLELSEDNIRRFIGPIKYFDWNKKTSPLAAFGGKKGTIEAYKLLLRHLAANGVEKANVRLAELDK